MAEQFGISRADEVLALYDGGIVVSGNTPQIDASITARPERLKSYVPLSLKKISCEFLEVPARELP
jgi:hypothetical protein